MPRWPKPAEGSWTQHYPNLDTGLISYEDSVSPEFYELEREAVFKRAWLNVGRIDLLPRNGSYFTKELAVANTSIIVSLAIPVRTRIASPSFTCASNSESPLRTATQ